MNDSKNIHVSDTAFVTCAFRRIDEKLSGDKYAKLWKNENAESILKDYISKVSVEEIQTHCIRNRYFLEAIRDYANTEAIEVLINFGAGFSMYPFLIDDSITHIEIDKPEVVDHKKKNLQKWISEGKLPKRHINFIGVDFSSDYWDALLERIKQIKKSKSCMILIEGVLFFLNKKETHTIFSFFDSIQSKNDIIGSVSYTDAIRKTKAFKRLMEYTSKGLKDASDQGCQTIENSFYENLNTYKIIDHQDYFSCSKIYNNAPKLDTTDILNEHFYLLQKK